MLICSSLSTAQLRVTFKFSIGVTKWVHQLIRVEFEEPGMFLKPNENSRNQVAPLTSAESLP